MPKHNFMFIKLKIRTLEKKKKTRKPNRLITTKNLK
jgi:hypothetical protein